MYAVEDAMRAYAKKFNADEQEWAVIGILHDFDYEKYPTMPDHPLKGSEILKEKGVSDEIRTTILSHASYTNVPRNSDAAKVLFACDELCGFISAVAVIRPNKIADLEKKEAKNAAPKKKIKID